MASETTPMIETQLKIADKDVRMGFVRKVYGILTVQLLLTAAITFPFQFMAFKALHSAAWLLYLSAFVTIAIMCSLICCAEKMREFPTNYMVLGVITVCTGVLTGFSCAAYTWQSVLLALGITVGIFLSMTVYAWTTSTDFTGAGPYLFASLSALCFFGFALSILGLCSVHIKWSVMFYDFLGVLLFTFYIVYDTQLMIGGNHKVKFSIDDYCFAALNLYLDIINLFLHLLSLLGERK
eukprot:TRINITY_DN647_c0_g1_i1.p1 TRINITY_DN647_c0_g1~~TRINITY_DN647_c0_g1_i1.p1  ORF type:complete len:257 (-),score=41.47 TRINITY_DN647_c0_g1_i1:10-723(-)